MICALAGMVFWSWLYQQISPVPSDLCGQLASHWKLNDLE